jgi:hypothetical protein
MRIRGPLNNLSGVSPDIDQIVVSYMLAGIHDELQAKRGETTYIDRLEPENLSSISNNAQDAFPRNRLIIYRTSEC